MIHGVGVALPRHGRRGGRRQRLHRRQPQRPTGSQVAFLQKTGTISQVVNFFPAAGSPTRSASAPPRGNFGTSNKEVKVDGAGAVVDTFTPASTRYTTYTTASFNVTAGSHAHHLRRRRSHREGLYRLARSGQHQQRFASIGCTDPVLRTRARGRAHRPTRSDPTGSAWSFSGTAGLAGNGSGFTAGNPDAPQGSQVAFLQAAGTMTQVVDLRDGRLLPDRRQRRPAGQQRHQQRGGQGAGGTGAVAHRHPASTSYATYATASFNVTAGRHTITFVGVDPTGKDYPPCSTRPVSSGSGWTQLCKSLRRRAVSVL